MKTTQIYRKNQLVAQVWLADRFWSRLRGLLGRSLPPEGGLLLAPCKQIHTWFMAYAIDAIYLDALGCVLRVDAQVAPWKMLKAQKKARYVLELPAGRGKELNLAVGDCLRRQTPEAWKEA